MHFYSCGMNTVCIENFKNCIPYLERLELSGDKDLNSNAIKIIADAIIEGVEKNVCVLKKLKIHSCEMDIKCVRNLQGCIPYLQSLSLRHNDQLCPESIGIISDSILNAVNKSSFKIKVLDFTGCHFTDAHVRQLLPCIRYLIHLYLRCNPNMTSQSVVMISDYLLDDIEKKL